MSDVRARLDAVENKLTAILRRVESQSTDTAFRKKLEEALAWIQETRSQGDASDSRELVEIVYDAWADVADVSRDVNVRCEHLRANIEPFVAKRSATFLTFNEAFFTRARERVRGEISKNVGSLTKIRETWLSFFDQRQKNLDRLKEQVAQFFELRHDSAELQAKLAHNRETMRLLDAIMDKPRRCIVLWPSEPWGQFSSAIKPDDLSNDRSECASVAQLPKQRRAELASRVKEAAKDFERALAKYSEEYTRTALLQGDLPWFGMDAKVKDDCRAALASLRGPLKEWRAALERESETITAEGRARYAALVEVGYFDVQPSNRETVLRRFDDALVSDFENNEHDWLSRDVTPTDGGGMLQSTIKEALTGEEARTMYETFVSAEETETKAFWSKSLVDVEVDPGSVVQMFDYAQTRHRELLQAQASAAAIGGTLAVAGPITAILVLAAGWHTLPWAIFALGPWALLSLPIAAVALLSGQDGVRQDMLAKAGAFLENQQAEARRTIDLAAVPACRAFGERIVESFSRRKLQERIGVDTLAEAADLEKTLNQIIHESSGGGKTLDVQVGVGPSFLQLALAANARGDAWAAASLAVQAFEETVQSWCRRYQLEIPVGEGSLRRATDSLSAHPRALAAGAGRLGRLRRKRNDWAHGMRDLRRLREPDRLVDVDSYLKELARTQPS